MLGMRNDTLGIGGHALAIRSHMYHEISHTLGKRGHALAKYTTCVR